MKMTACRRDWRSALYFLSLSLVIPACADFSAGGPSTEEDIAPPISPALDRSLFERGSSIPRDLGVRDPCDPNPCAAGERCLADEGDGGDPWRCVAIACESISCAPDERCVAGEGGEPRCVPLSCAGDGDCALGEFCDLEETRCLRDLCEGGRARCEEDQLVTCAENGSREGAPVSCGTASRCEEGEEGAFCACGSDWDCPSEGEARARCEQGRCVGVGAAERCLLPPVPFSESLPTPELVWGSSPGEQAAVGRPFPESTQVVMTPVVANLSDDNGDGLIDERDYPELIFMSFCGSSFRMNGALRVVAGGGPARGDDLLTVLGDRLWRLDEPLPQGYSCEEGDLDPTGALAVGDLDAEGEAGARGTRGPEIVAPHEQRGVVVYSATGERLFDTAALGVGPGRGRNPAVAIANLDGVGPAEIITGATVFMLRYDEAGRLQPGESFSGTLGSGRNGQGPVSCIADIDEDGRLEVIGGGSVYRLPRPPVGAQERGDCAEAGGVISPQNSEEEDWCAGRLSLVWNSAEVNPNLSSSEGFCAVADILGADELQPPGPENPLDGRPELILISSGRLQIFNGSEGMLRLNIPLRLGENGGAPNVGDFDGDGFPEVGSAFARGYAMIDLQLPSEACAPWTEAISDDEAGPAREPGDACEDDGGCAEGARCLEGRCQCLHNGWRRSTEDDSSRVTGSTLFDFNGDGAVEVVYNDECWFRIYDGRRGEVLFKEPSESRTRIENPIVADVDNDGNAEIIFSTSTESEFCSQRREPAGGGEGRLLDLYNAGVEVWGDPQDRWVPARRIWNQHSYAVTHVEENGNIPREITPHWSLGSAYNSFRAQPQSDGVAPDLVALSLSLGDLDGGCVDTAEEGATLLRFLVSNRGEVQVGAEIEASFEGRWGERWRALEDGAGPLRQALGAPLAPGAQRFLSLSYDPSADPGAMGGLPDVLRATIDPTNEALPFGAERECREENNSFTIDLSMRAEGGQPDLQLSFTAVDISLCPRPRVTLLAANRGSEPSPESVISIYAGDPSQGAARIDQLEVPELAPEEEVSLERSLPRLPPEQEISLFAVIDPRNEIFECDEENSAQAPEAISCQFTDGF